MASIIKRKYTYSVGYQTKDRNGTSITRWETYYTYPEALARKKELDTGIQSSYIAISPDIKMKDYLMKYCNIYGIEAWSISTYNCMISITYHYLIPHVGNIKLGMLDKKTQRDYTINYLTHYLFQLEIVKKKLVLLYYIKSITSYVCAIDYAIMNGLEITNPFHEVRVEGSKNVRTTSPDWSTISLLKLLTNCDHNYLLLLLHLIFGCNLQIKEDLALSWDNIHIDENNLNTGYVTIVNETNRYSLNVLSKLHKEDIVKIYQPVYTSSSTTRKAIIKLQGSQRKEGIPKKIVPILILFKQQYEDLKQKNDFTDDNLLFCRNDGYPYEIRMIEKEFSKLKKKLDLPNLHLAKLRSFGNNKKNIKKVYDELEDIDISKLTEELKKSSTLLDELTKLLNV